MKNVNSTVERILRSDKYARENDIYLQFLTLKELGLPTDLAQWEKFEGNVLESIRRQRQKLQAKLPELRAGERTRHYRTVKEEEFREAMRG